MNPIFGISTFRHTPGKPSSASPGSLPVPAAPTAPKGPAPRATHPPRSIRTHPTGQGHCPRHRCLAGSHPLSGASFMTLAGLGLAPDACDGCGGGGGAGSRPLEGRPAPSTRGSMAAAHRKCGWTAPPPVTPACSPDARGHRFASCPTRPLFPKAAPCAGHCAGGWGCSRKANLTRGLSSRS